MSTLNFLDDLRDEQAREISFFLIFIRIIFKQFKLEMFFLSSSQPVRSHRQSFGDGEEPLSTHILSWADNYHDKKAHTTYFCYFFKWFVEYLKIVITHCISDSQSFLFILILAITMFHKI